MLTGNITLFPFQQEDVDKLADQPSVLIGNEMGTGKSIEAVARDAALRVEYPPPIGKPGPTLVIAPLSVLSSWRVHFENMTDLKVMQINNKKRDQSWQAFEASDADVLLIHWDALRLMQDDLDTVQWFHVIADEVHRAQNRETKWTKVLKGLHCNYKTGLSGTPITNQPDKLWSILNWLYPKGPGNSVKTKAPLGTLFSNPTDPYYTSYWRFRGKFVEDATLPKQLNNPMAGTYRVIVGPKKENMPLLHEMMRPYFVRHLKKETCCPHHPGGVLSELPDKVYTPIWVELIPKQRKHYDEMRKDSLTWVGQNEDKPLASPAAISVLMRLQQFTVATCDIGPDGRVVLSDPSSKLDALMQLLDDNPTEQFVVFSQFAQLITLLNKRMKDKGISYVSIMGSVPAALRGGLVDKFQAGEKRVFTGTIAAGGEGITLTSASTVVFLDRAWSPAMNSQAEDRLHRIGQKDTVNVIDIMGVNTVDLGKSQKLATKWADIRTMLGDGNNSDE